MVSKEFYLDFPLCTYGKQLGSGWVMKDGTGTGLINTWSEQ